MAQDVLTKMLDYRQGWLSSISFRVWIKRAVLNRVIDASRRRRRWSIVQPLGDGIDIPDDAPGADSALQASQVSAVVARAVRALPERQRQAIVLCHYEGLNLADAAAAMDASVGAVEQLLHRAKNTLRVELQELSIWSEWR